MIKPNPNSLKVIPRPIFNLHKCGVGGNLKSIIISGIVTSKFFVINIRKALLVKIKCFIYIFKYVWKGIFKPKGKFDTAGTFSVLKS